MQSKETIISPIKHTTRTYKIADFLPKKQSWNILYRLFPNVDILTLKIMVSARCRNIKRNSLVVEIRQQQPWKSFSSTGLWESVLIARSRVAAFASEALSFLNPNGNASKH